MMIVFGSSLVARHAQCMVYCVESLVGGCVYPRLDHLCWKAAPPDPKMTSFGNGDIYILICVE
jgi:hypothetical protein